MIQDRLAFLVALHSIEGLGPIRLKKVLDYFKDPKVAWNADFREFKQLGIPYHVIETLKSVRKKLIPESYYQNIIKNGVKILTLYDENYPKLLKQIYDPPVVLFYKGEFIPSDKKAIGIVGTRKVTSYGKTITEKFSSELVHYGFTIVSGLARGVDTVAHQIALDSKGRTIAVLGGGINKIFPSENYNLSQKISDGNGAVISEYPPEHPSLAGNFPSRNRIIAGISLGVLVTEAAEDSGSLITAKASLEEGREVFAIPGPITSDLSKGPSLLIKQGAKLVTCTQDILQELGIDCKTLLNSNQLIKISNIQLTDFEKMVVDQLENETKHIDDFCRDLKKPSSEISATLIKLEILGIVKSLGGGNFSKII